MEVDVGHLLPSGGAVVHTHKEVGRLELGRELALDLSDAIEEGGAGGGREVGDALLRLLGNDERVAGLRGLMSRKAYHLSPPATFDDGMSPSMIFVKSVRVSGGGAGAAAFGVAGDAGVPLATPQHDTSFSSGWRRPLAKAALRVSMISLR
jgi:hypothetical protein